MLPVMAMGQPVNMIVNGKHWLLQNLHITVRNIYSDWPESWSLVITHGRIERPAGGPRRYQRTSVLVGIPVKIADRMAAKFSPE